MKQKSFDETVKIYGGIELNKDLGERLRSNFKKPVFNKFFRRYKC